MRKPAFCICENEDADQLRGNREAVQRLCFRYTDSTTLYFLNPTFQASSRLLSLHSPVCIGPGRKPRIPVFSQRGSFDVTELIAFKIFLFSFFTQLIPHGFVTDKYCLELYGFQGTDTVTVQIKN